MTRERKYWSKCTQCGTVYKTPRTWQFCTRECRKEWVRKGIDIPVAQLVRERLEIALRIETAMPWERQRLVEHASALEHTINERGHRP